MLRRSRYSTCSGGQCVSGCAAGGLTGAVRRRMTLPRERPVGVRREVTRRRGALTCEADEKEDACVRRKHDGYIH